MWSLRCYFTISPLQGHLTVLKVTVCHTAGHYGEEYVCLKQCRLEVAAELMKYDSVSTSCVTVYIGCLSQNASSLSYVYCCSSWWRGTVVERRALTGELSLYCARPAADG